jgi:succinate dehydrogenase/fumarate reductase flavoprotein subunit
MTDWDMECDALIVGSGGGGLVGAYTAASEGLSTILIEATDKFGGTTAYSGSGMWLPTNPVLRRAGSKDTLEAAGAYYHAVVGDRTPRALREAYLDTGHRLIAFLEQNPWLRFQVFPWPDYYGHVPHASAEGRHIIAEGLELAALGDLRDSLRPNLTTERQGQPRAESLFGGQALIARLLLAVKSAGSAELHLNTAMESLVVEDGRVVGAVAQTPSGSVRIHAKRGVLIAAGGFEQNDAMRRRYGVAASAKWSMGAPGNFGRPIEAGIAVGAATDLMGECWWSPGLIHPDGTATFSVGILGGIFVNGAGQRFTNESQPYDIAGRDALKGEATGVRHIPFWQIYDERFGQRPPVLNVSIALQPAEDYLAAGLWHQADTLEELAARIGVPPQALVETVARYNGFAATGVDLDFHRGETAYDRFFVGPTKLESTLVSLESPDFGDAIGSGREANPCLVPIDRPRFYAAAYGVSDLGTKGGLRTDPDARVLTADGAVIPGLYAAGNSMAAVSGTTYPGGGNPIGSSIVFAYRAALDMLAAPKP